MAGRTPPLEFLRRLTGGNPANIQGTMELPGGLMRFDNVAGLGHTSNHANIAYRGGMLALTPRQFLRLAYPLGGHRNYWLERNLKERVPVATPQLYVKMSVDGPRKIFGEVEGHEGRHRAKWLLDQGYDDLMPVALWPAGYYRAKHLNKDLLSSTFRPLRSETGTLFNNDDPLGIILNDEYLEFRHGGRV